MSEILTKAGTSVLNMRVDSGSCEDAVLWTAEMAKASRSAYVCVANVHMVMEAYDSPAFRRIVNKADLVVPDGRPLVWALKALGVRGASQVRGADLMLRLVEKAASEGFPIGLYGGAPDSLRELVGVLEQRFPGLLVACAISPPFRELSAEEDAEFVHKIRDSGARIVFVGLGCPKQERWMASHRGDIPAVMVGVGAAFDFLAGRVRQAPRWMQRAGLEWAFRLAMEPRRLWRRYAKHNPRFVWLIIRQVLRERVLGMA